MKFFGFFSTTIAKLLFRHTSAIRDEAGGDLCGCCIDCCCDCRQLSRSLPTQHLVMSWILSLRSLPRIFFHRMYVHQQASFLSFFCPIPFLPFMSTHHLLRCLFCLFQGCPQATPSCNGQCQVTSLSCSAGAYQPGLCPGTSNIECMHAQEISLVLFLFF